MKKTYFPPKKYTAHKARPTNATSFENDSPLLFAKHLLKSAAFTLLTGLTLIVLFSLAAYFYPDPDRIIQPLALIASALTALIGGLIAVRIHGHSALLCGFGNGALVSAVMIFASLFMKGLASGYTAWISCLIHCAFLGFSVLGAFWGLKKKKVKRKY